MVATEDQAKRALTQLHSGTVDFQSLAQQISLGPTAQQGGLLTQWVMRANEKAIQYGSEEEAQAAGVISLDPVLEGAAFAIGDVQQVSGYVKGPDSRYHIFQLVERQPARERPIAEVWDQIQNYLLEQQRREAVDALGKKAVIERFAERLSEVTQE
jgi:parvulin-like peptidyl-prolyl isomerase